jgi:hypothetical protein
MGMPLSYESEKAYLLHPEMVPYLTDEEIQTLLTKNVMTDGAAIEDAVFESKPGEEWQLDWS